MFVGFFVSVSQGCRGICPTYAKLYAHRVRYLLFIYLPPLAWLFASDAAFYFILFYWSFCFIYNKHIHQL